MQPSVYKRQSDSPATTPEGSIISNNLPVWAQSECLYANQTLQQVDSTNDCTRQETSALNFLTVNQFLFCFCFDVHNPKCLSSNWWQRLELMTSWVGVISPKTNADLMLLSGVSAKSVHESPICKTVSSEESFPARRSGGNHLPVLLITGANNLHGLVFQRRAQGIGIKQKVSTSTFSVPWDSPCRSQTFQRGEAVKIYIW